VCCCCGAAVLTLSAALFLVFPVARLRLRGFELWFLMPGRQPFGGHFRLLRRLRDWMRRGIRMSFGGWSRCILDIPPPTYEVILPHAQFHLLGRIFDLLSFRSPCWFVATLSRLRSCSCFASICFTLSRQFLVWFPSATAVTESAALLVGDHTPPVDAHCCG